MKKKKNAARFASVPAANVVPWASTGSYGEVSSWRQGTTPRPAAPLRRPNPQPMLRTVTPLLGADSTRDRRTARIADDACGVSSEPAQSSERSSRERVAAPSGYEAISSADPLSAQELLGAISALGSHHEFREEEPEVSGDQTLCWRSAGEEALGSLWFQGSMGGIILLNAIAIGIETDNAKAIPPGVEAAFLGIFTLETVARLVIFGPARFFDSDSLDFKWNLFDLVIVSLGIFDEASAVVAPQLSVASGYMTVFRILRLMRILRVFRIIRFLRQLYSLAVGFALSTTAVFWVTFLMTFVLYVSAIVLVRTLGRAEPSDPHYDLLHNRFGTVFQAMETLFQLMAVPDLDPYHDVMSEMPLFTAFIFAFTIFGSFGMIAMLTGVISENMFEKNWDRAQEEGESRRLKCLLLIQRAEELFSDQDLNVKGEASRDDLVRLLPQIQGIFEEHDIAFTEEELVGMIEVIDAEGRGSVRREEFRHFIVQMAQGVRPLLIMELYYAIKMVMKKQEQNTKVGDEILELSQRSSLERTYHVTTLTGKLDDLRAHVTEQVSNAQRDILQQQASSNQGIVEQVALVRASVVEITAEISQKLGELGACQARIETDASRVLVCEATAQESRSLLESLRCSLLAFDSRLDGLVGAAARPSPGDVPAWGTPNELAAKASLSEGLPDRGSNAPLPFDAAPMAGVRRVSEPALPPSGAASLGESADPESTSQPNTSTHCSGTALNAGNSRASGANAAMETHLGGGGETSSSSA